MRSARGRFLLSVVLGTWVVAGAPAALAASAPASEIRLWPGKAPGTGSWTVPEAVTSSPSGDRTVSNVSDPTLTVFLPDPAIATGTAVILAPGGALRVLGIDSNGTHIARWLNARGIAAFVLKYRTLQQAASGAGGPAAGAARRAAAPPGGGGQRQELEMRNANANPAPDDPALAEVLAMGVADAQEAFKLIRRNAQQWRINPARVGIMGFSAGGGVAVGTAMAAKSDAYPDFMFSIYGPALQDVHVTDYAPPLFIAVGSTHFNVTKGCIALFEAWREAGKPAEMHVYDGVSAGFGISERGLPVDGWIDRAYEWMVARKITDVR
jgi:acetyl esterase/lipase